jgi:uncharacterized protein YdhG (YjbR/CyaY superfamily)
MPRTEFKSVAEYIAAQPETAQRVLKRVRSTIRKALPGAKETISYKMPAYELHGDVALYFAGWKQHYSLYPANARVVAALKDDLAPYKIKKSTLHLSLSEPVPVKLIERLAKFRAHEIATRAKPRAAAPKKP